MSTHPEISHLAKEERIRLIAYAIWEEEGRPHGRDEEHWRKAAELVEAEAQPEPGTGPGEPQWLQRESAISTGEPAPEEKPMTLEQLARRIASVKAA